MRLIDADELLEDVRQNSQSYWADDFAYEWVNRQPTVDAVPVVRCKDCKYFTRDTITGVTIPGSEYCIFTTNNRIEGDDFCSRAERKEE